MSRRPRRDSEPYPRPDRRPPRSRARRIAGLTLKLAIGGGFAALVALVVTVFVVMASLPGFSELKSSPNGRMIRVHALDGKVLVSLGPSYGKWLPYDRIPQVMKDAMIAVEDRRFYRHPGVDPIGVARSLKVRLQTGRFSQGGSTITQQLSRNLFLTNTRTFARKFREMIYALALERKFSKEEILELYLNKVYFGGGAYGIDAASRRFFGHGADEGLNLAEAAVIAGLVKAPSNYSPTADVEAARGRAGVVIETMIEAGRISPAEARAARPDTLRIVPEPRQNSVRYFTDWVLDRFGALVEETEEQKSQPIDVWTTLDLKMQQAADAAIRANVPPGTQGALVALDRDGAVRAMVGGTDYVSSIYNRATQAVRQPGSAFKLFVYLAALDAGMHPSDIVADRPIEIDGWSPRNSSRRYAGDVDLRTAFAFSINTVAAQLGARVGFETVRQMAQRFGITTPINVHPSMVLGTSDVRLIDMTRAFAAVARQGAAVVPYGILRVTTASNELIYEYKPDDMRVLIGPEIAAEMTDLLQTAVNTGTARAAQIGRPVAGKTGTTSSNKDGWFLGFSSGITTGVWMGRDDARPVPGLQGGRAPARAFAQFMTKAVADRPVEEFETEVTLPEWQQEPDAQAYMEGPDEGFAMDENGQAVPLPDGGGGFSQFPSELESPAPPPGAEGDGDWLRDHPLGQGRERRREPDYGQREPVRRAPRRDPPPGMEEAPVVRRGSQPPAPAPGRPENLFQGFSPNE